MIPEKLIPIAEAEYLCNVTQFICLGEGEQLTPREICSIKGQHICVADWFEHLDTLGQLRLMKHLKEEHNRVVSQFSFFGIEV